MGRIRVEHLAIHHLAAHGLQDDLIEYLLVDRAVQKPAPPILAQGGGIRHLVAQAKAQKPAVGHIDLDVPYQLALAPDPEQVADEKHLEQNHRVHRWTPGVGTVETPDPLPDGAEIYGPLNLAQKVVAGNQLLDAHKLH